MVKVLCLATDGVTTTQVLDEKGREVIYRKLQGFLQNAPEFSPEFCDGTLDAELQEQFPNVRECDRRALHVGSFGALNTSSSFHNPPVRFLRLFVHEHAKKTIVSAFKGNGIQIPDNFHQVIDRVGVRTKGQKPTSESWHRDESRFAYDGDMVFGGWVNLSDHSEYFSCVPGTQQPGKNRGFAPIRDAAEIAAAKAGKVLVEVLPGHLLNNVETIVQEVN